MLRASSGRSSLMWNLSLYFCEFGRFIAGPRVGRGRKFHSSVIINV